MNRNKAINQHKSNIQTNKIIIRMMLQYEN